MSDAVSGYLVSVLLVEDLLALNRAVGIIRRRNLGVESLTLGQSLRPGLSRLACLVRADGATVERLGNQLRKMVGVEQVEVLPESGCTAREQLLARVRVSPAQLAALLDLIALYDGAILEESPQELTLEATGAPALLSALLRALEPFGLLEAARGGTLALARPGLAEPGGSARPAGTTPRIATAIPA